MSLGHSYLELIDSQLPALQLLINMGWQYLTPAEALALRGGREGNVLLTGVLEPWLRQHNTIRFKGQRHAFSDGNISEAIRQLSGEALEGLLVTNKRLYERLTLGTSLPQTIGGDRKSFSLHFVDWQHPERNLFHVADEFPVEKRGSHSTRRPDIVLFVNGIPLVVIECKRADQEHHGEKAIALGIEQLLTYQKEEEIPHLFAFSQLLLAISRNDASYATTGTSKKFWTLWREEAPIERLCSGSSTRPLPRATRDRLYNWRPFPQQLHQHFDAGLRQRGSGCRPSRIAPFTPCCAPHDCSSCSMASSSSMPA